MEQLSLLLFVFYLLGTQKNLAHHRRTKEAWKYQSELSVLKFLHFTILMCCSVILTHRSVFFTIGFTFSHSLILLSIIVIR